MKKHQTQRNLVLTLGQNLLERGMCNGQNVMNLNCIFFIVISRAMMIMTRH